MSKKLDMFLIKWITVTMDPILIALLKLIWNVKVDGPGPPRIKAEGVGICSSLGSATYDCRSYRHRHNQGGQRGPYFRTYSFCALRDVFQKNNSAIRLELNIFPPKKFFGRPHIFRLATTWLQTLFACTKNTPLKVTTGLQTGEELESISKIL